MTLFVDDLVDYGFTDSLRRGVWCHLWSDTSTEELVAFARSIGLKPGWIQRPHRVVNRFTEHFDLRASKRLLAIQQGATPIQATAYLRHLYETGLVERPPSLSEDLGETSDVE